MSSIVTSSHWCSTVVIVGKKWAARAEVKLRSLVRRMRVYNLIPGRFGSAPLHIPLTTLIEDAVHRDSVHSFFLQLSDVNAFFLHQKMAPCGYVRRKGARQYFSRLNPVLCTVASATDPQGIVRL